MAVESVDDINVGDTIRFKTYDPHDNVYWVGKVISLCTYDIARQYNGSNVDNYYQEVKRVMPELKDKTNLNYFLLQVNQGENTDTIVFAKEWVEPSTLEHVDTTSYYDLRIYGIDSSKLQDIIKLIGATYPGYAIEQL